MAGADSSDQHKKHIDYAEAETDASPHGAAFTVTWAADGDKGTLVGETRQDIILTAPADGTLTTIPLPSVLAVTPVDSCA